MGLPAALDELVDAFDEGFFHDDFSFAKWLRVVCDTRYRAQKNKL
jgi:hypothetical protein